jgi:hypothetical protein
VYHKHVLAFTRHTVQERYLRYINTQLVLLSLFNDALSSSYIVERRMRDVNVKDRLGRILRKEDVACSKALKGKVPVRS